MTSTRTSRESSPEPDRKTVVDEGPDLGVTARGSTVFHSFRAALAGVGRTVATQRNMKLHVISALMVTIVGMALPFDLDLRVSLLFAIALVFFAEILNSGLEALVDLFVEDFHRLAMFAKDAAAAGVLVLSIAAALIFAEIVWTRWDLVTDNIDAVARSVIYGGPLVVIVGFVLFVARRRAWLVAALAGALALTVPLLSHGRDPIFAGLAIALIALACWSRFAFPAHIGRGARERRSSTKESRANAETHDD
jgi:diacylglycerol kinase (ATP)